MNLNKAKKLEQGDTIGVIAPSSGLAELFPHRADKGQEMLEKLGFKVVFAKHSKDRVGWTASSPQDRAEDIHLMFKDPNIKAIICTIGGNHANQVLKYLDFDVIKNNPKIFIGYSDITILHFAFAQKANLCTFYGPCLISEFGEFPEILPYTLEYFKKALMQTNPIGEIKTSDTWTDEFLNWFTKEDLERPRKFNEHSGIEWWKTGKAEGKIFGGAIPSINHLAGSEYWVDFNDKILFLDIPEGDEPGKLYSQSWLDSFLADLDNLKVFSSIKGLIIGRPYGYSDEDTQILKERILYYTENYDYPIVYNVNIGHTAPIITVPLGSNTILDSEKNLFSINENGVN